MAHPVLAGQVLYFREETIRPSTPFAVAMNGPFGTHAVRQALLRSPGVSSVHCGVDQYDQPGAVSYVPGPDQFSQVHVLFTS